MIGAGLLRWGNHPQQSSAYHGGQRHSDGYSSETEPPYWCASAANDPRIR
jgi:hypothetical protein